MYFSQILNPSQRGHFCSSINTQCVNPDISNTFKYLTFIKPTIPTLRLLSYLPTYHHQKPPTTYFPYSAVQLSYNRIPHHFLPSFLPTYHKHFIIYLSTSLSLSSIAYTPTLYRVPDSIPVRQPPAMRRYTNLDFQTRRRRRLLPRAH